MFAIAFLRTKPRTILYLFYMGSQQKRGALVCFENIYRYVHFVILIGNKVGTLFALLHHACSSDSGLRS